MRSFFAVLLLITFYTAVAQDNELTAVERRQDSLLVPPDPKYREDQMYASVSYNLISGQPEAYKQNGVSASVSMGLLRDFPLNKRRNHAIAVGLGYAYSNIKHNMLVTKGSPQNTYSVDPKVDYDKNKLVLQYLEMPIEFRWRTSTDSTHMFWRVYTGVKLSYLFYDKAQVYYPEYSMKVKNDPDLNKFTAGAYVAAGYNTWNFYFYYGLTPLYDGPFTDAGEKLKMRSMKFGLMFYIL